MNEHENPEDVLTAEMRAIALEQIKSGAAEEHIEALLVAKGLDPKAATDLVADVIRTRYDSGKGLGFSAAGVNTMLMGAVTVVGGVVLPLIEQGYGGQPIYYISWGAIIFGSIRFFLGLMEYFGL
ncbi:MAG: hypothetical protein QGG42_00370 [Phycisphaerae bacterium]|jgi:hypothetical protein|nr:hypothetical protein [Phycisphaerae bacterium]